MNKTGMTVTFQTADQDRESGVSNCSKWEETSAWQTARKLLMSVLVRMSTRKPRPLAAAGLLERCLKESCAEEDEQVCGQCSDGRA